MEWLNPKAFWLFLLLAIPIYCWMRRKNYLPYSTLSFEGLAEASFFKRNLPRFLEFAACSCIVLALASPVRPYKEETKAYEGRRIILVQDYSGSMRDKGEKICREAAVSFLDTLPVKYEDEKSCTLMDEIAGVFFGGDHVREDPPMLTNDRNVIKEVIERSSVAEFGGGTVFSVPLSHAAYLLMLQKMQEGLSFKEAAGARTAAARLLNKMMEVDEEEFLQPLTMEEEKFIKEFGGGNVVIMLTDGYPNGDDVLPTEIVIRKVFLPLGIKYYLCSVEAMPEGLREPIAATGGQHFVDPDFNNWKSILVDEINKHEKMKFVSIEITRNYPLFHFFALLAIVLMFGEYVSRIVLRIHN